MKSRKPKKTDEEKRSFIIIFRIKEDEKNALDSDARADGVTPNELARRRTVREERRGKTLSADERIKLISAGTDLNRLEQKYKKAGESPPEELQRARETIEDFLKKYL